MPKNLKEAILREPELAETTKGVSIIRPEEFVVKPKEIEVEIVSSDNKKLKKPNLNPEGCQTELTNLTAHFLFLIIDIRSFHKQISKKGGEEKMRRLKTGGFAEIFRIAKEDKHFFKYRKQLIGAQIRVNWLSSRDGPWVSVTGVLVLRDIYLNGTKIKKGDHVCFRKAFLKALCI